MHPVPAAGDHVLHDAAVLGELLQDEGGGGRREPEHGHPGFVELVVGGDGLALRVERIDLSWGGRCLLGQTVVVVVLTGLVRLRRKQSAATGST